MISHGYDADNKEVWNMSGRWFFEESGCVSRIKSLVKNISYGLFDGRWIYWEYKKLLRGKISW